MMKLKKIILKQFSLILAICMILSVFGVMNASAAENDITIRITGGRNAKVGEIFNVNLKLIFADADYVATHGVFTLRSVVKFDKNVFIPVDPDTGEEITANQYGEAEDGSSFFKLGEIVTDTSLTANLSSDGNAITFMYGDTKSNDIYTAGIMATLAFRVNPEIEVNNTKGASISLAESRISGRNLTYDDKGNIETSELFYYNTSEVSWTGSVVPPFTAPTFRSAKRQNDVLEVSAATSLPEDAELIASIVDSQGNVIEEQQTEIANGKYKATFTLSEELYAPGTYSFKLNYMNTATSTAFTIQEKLPDPAPPAPPVDETPDEGEDDNTSTDNPPTDDPSTEIPGEDDGEDDGEDNTENNVNKPTHTGGSTTGSIGIPSTSDKTDDKDEENEEPADTEKPTDVVYPSDIGSHWAEENIKYVYDNKLMNGYEDGTFGAEQPITRAEFATVISRLLGLAEAPDNASFADCTKHWAKGYIGALAAQGIVGGVNDTDFAPDENITREQIAVILSRALKLEEPFDSMAVFMDEESISDWAYADVYKVLEAGYMKGDDLGNFNPLANATRAEVATVIYRLHSAK